MKFIINYYVIDPKNIGDLYSSPIQYFKFPSYQLKPVDIRKSIDPEYLRDKHIILGGGGLLFSRFLSQIATLVKSKEKNKIIAWGIGQQIYYRYPELTNEDINSFDYSCMNNFDLVGIRDFGFKYHWVPCVSCMHESFTKKREIKHDFVVFSHKKFQLKIDNFPSMTNEIVDLEQVLDFLASGETVLTSSYHGAYWATLLGRKVLAFPFSSKFYTLKHKPSIYPIKKWIQQKRFFWGKLKFSFVDKLNLRYQNKFSVQTSPNWQNHLKYCKSYPNSLQESRQQNEKYYHQVMQVIAANRN